MEVKTIKDVDPAVWSELKGLAAKSKVPMGKMLEKVVHSYRNTEADKVWEHILNAGRIISDKEADDALAAIKKWRSEPGFR